VVEVGLFAVHPTRKLTTSPTFWWATYTRKSDFSKKWCKKNIRET